jgi:PTH1 family peptidyl-tRNA hydrolase
MRAMDGLRIILGIGNPGAQYQGTRHNIGWEPLDRLHHRLGAGPWAKKWHAEVAQAAWKDHRLLLVKPTTFVNASGEAAQAILAFHKAAPADLLVVVDDLNLPLGDLRLRADGSAGGHNGLRDIEARIGTSYPRLRMGIGRPRPDQDQIGFVLGRFAPDERPDADLCAAKAADAILAWVETGVQVACRYNGPLRPAPPKPKPEPVRPDTPAAAHPPGPAGG